MQKVTFALLVVAGLATHARAASRSEFMGWSADLGYYVVHIMTEGDEGWMFCSTRPDGKGTWPASVGAPEDGGCVSIVGEPERVPPKLKSLVGAPASTLTGPGGAKVSVSFGKAAPDAAGRPATVTVTAGGKKATAKIDDAYVGAKLTKAYWRSDGGQVAVLLDTGTGKPEEDGGLMPSSVVVVDTSRLGLAASPAGDRKGAEAANRKGMDSVRQHAWTTAADQFRAAIAADPSFLLAHYNLACVASLAGDAAAARTELAWVAASSDAGAAAVLKKAATDPDLDFASTDPEVRRLLGLPAYGKLDARARLTERDGVWSTDGGYCASSWLKITFTGDGKVKIRERGGCDADNTDRTVTGTFTAAGAFRAGAELSGKIEWERCEGSAVDASCFRLRLGEQGANSAGPFRRGDWLTAP